MGRCLGGYVCVGAVCVSGGQMMSDGDPGVFEDAGKGDEAFSDPGDPQKAGDDFVPSDEGGNGDDSLPSDGAGADVVPVSPTLSSAVRPGASTTLSNTTNVVLRFEIDVSDASVPMSCLKFSYSFAGPGQVQGATLYWDSSPLSGSYLGGEVNVILSPERTVVPGTPVVCFLELVVGGSGPGSSLLVSQMWDPSCAVGAIQGSWSVGNTLTYP